jgi:hypothetical protein
MPQRLGKAIPGLFFPHLQVLIGIESAICIDAVAASNSVNETVIMCNPLAAEFTPRKRKVQLSV